MRDVLNLAGKELLCQQSIRKVMAVLRLSESCMRNTLRVWRGLCDVKLSNPVGQILEVKESTKKNTIEIYIQTGKY